MSRTRLPPSLAAIRSAKSNGTRLLDGCDHRTSRMRRFRDLIGMHVGDLGGADACSAAELSLIRRASLLTLELEVLESKFEQEGGASIKQLECYQRVAGSLRRLLESIGLKRRAKDITSLGEILWAGQHP